MIGGGLDDEIIRLQSGFTSVSDGQIRIFMVDASRSFGVYVRMWTELLVSV